MSKSIFVNALAGVSSVFVLIVYGAVIHATNTEHPMDVAVVIAFLAVALTVALPSSLGANPYRKMIPVLLKIGLRGWLKILVGVSFQSLAIIPIRALLDKAGFDRTVIVSMVEIAIPTALFTCAFLFAPKEKPAPASLPR